ncbi:hypothetical protein MJ1HA_0189 [Metallosphaera sedula]|nr:hypothetical protein MJ1HA_0189 [Metallosphaera sedula]
MGVFNYGNTKHLCLIFIRTLIYKKIMMRYNKILALATIRGSLALIKESIENDDIDRAIKLARYFKLKFEDKSDEKWWYRQWHSVMESVEHKLREGFIESAYRTLEQAEFHLSVSVIVTPNLSRASVKQSKP